MLDTLKLVIISDLRIVGNVVSVQQKGGKNRKCKHLICDGVRRENPCRPESKPIAPAKSFSGKVKQKNVL